MSENNQITDGPQPEPDGNQTDNPTAVSISDVARRIMATDDGKLLKQFLTQEWEIGVVKAGYGQNREVACNELFRAAGIRMVLDLLNDAPRNASGNAKQHGISMVPNGMGIYGSKQ